MKPASLIDRFLERIGEKSSGNFHDDSEDGKGVFNIYGVSIIHFHSSGYFSLHANIHLRDRKLPSLRTHALKNTCDCYPTSFVKMDSVGHFGRGGGAYGQMHCISLILQGFRDNWIEPGKTRSVF